MFIKPDREVVLAVGDSMSPCIPDQSKLYLEDAKYIKIGDVINYYSPLFNESIAHRVIDIDETYYYVAGVNSCTERVPRNQNIKKVVGVEFPQ